MLDFLFSNFGRYCGVRRRVCSKCKQRMPRIFWSCAITRLCNHAPAIKAVMKDMAQSNSSDHVGERKMRSLCDKDSDARGPSGDDEIKCVVATEKEDKRNATICACTHTVKSCELKRDSIFVLGVAWTCGKFLKLEREVFELILM